MASIAATSPSREARTRMGFASPGAGPASVAEFILASIVDLETQSLPDDIGMEPNGPGRVRFAIEPLDLGLEAGEGVGAALEHLEIVQHRMSALAQALARHDGRDPRRIDDEQGRGDAA